jgi:hypothetical protein
MIASAQVFNWITKLSSVLMENFVGNGLPVCTKMGCIGSFGNMRRKRGNEPGTMRQVTMAEYDSASFRCTPQEFFKLECNRCKCGPDGKTVSRCTKIKCVDGQ